MNRVARVNREAREALAIRAAERTERRLPPDDDFAGCGVLFPDFDNSRDPSLKFLDVGDDAHMLAACRIQFLQRRHYTVQPLLAQSAEALIDEDRIDADAVLGKA